jgi:hypothetical protein
MDIYIPPGTLAGADGSQQAPVPVAVFTHGGVWVGGVCSPPTTRQICVIWVPCCNETIYNSRSSKRKGKAMTQ